MSVWRRMWVSSLLLGAAAAALAQDLELSGFGTLSAYRGDDTQVAVRPKRFVPESSRDGQWRWDGDSVLGLQARWTLSPQWQAVWQVQLADEAGHRYRPNTEWLYLGWTLSPAWSLRLGRQPLPIQQHSETRSVGITRVTVRPMATVYELISNTPVDGATLSWNGDVGGGVMSVDLATGVIDVQTGTTRARGRSLSSLSARWQFGPTTLRLGYTLGLLDLLNSPLDTQTAALRQPGSPCPNCAAVLDARAPTLGLEVGRLSAGLSWAWKDWALDVEALRRRSNSAATPAALGWYALLSHRWGTLTPFLAHGATRFMEAPLGLQAAPGVPPEVAAGIAALDLSLQSRNDRRITLLGLRWDLQERAALKLQFEHWRATRDTTTPRSDEILLPAGSTAWNGRVNLLSASLDFVF